MSSNTIYEMINDKIISHLENGVAPWRQPWTAADSAPRNIDGYRYRGINVWLLIMESLQHGYSSPYWLTFKQAQAKGGNVRKGEKSTVIVFWKKIMVKEKDEVTGKIEKKVVPMLRYFRVFNLEQTEGVTIPARAAEEMANAGREFDHDPIAEAEAIVKGWEGAPRISRRGTSAYYRPATDVITVPPLSRHASAGEFYSTLFHEMGHATGHASRLDRFKGNAGFGSHDYGREELVAEMTAAYLNAEAGILDTVPNSAAYLAGWIKTIKSDVRAVVVAAGAAQRAADMIMGRTDDRPAAADADTEQADMERAA